MSRYFERAVIPGDSGYLTLSPGAAATGGPFTFLIVFRLDSIAQDRDLAMAQTAAAGTVWALNHSGGQLFWSMGGGFVTLTSVLANTWYMLGVTKPAGNAQVRAHLCDMAADSWSHGNVGALNDSAGPIDHIWFGRAFGSYLGGYIAAAATGAINPGDSAVEALRPGLAQWLAAPLAPVWRMNDIPVADLGGSGANQTALQGTTVNTAIEPPNFSYDTSTEPQPPEPEPGPEEVIEGSFWQWLSVLHTGAAEYYQEKRREFATECPNDGEPLQMGPDGQLYCRYDGYRPSLADTAADI